LALRIKGTGLVQFSKAPAEVSYLATIKMKSRWTPG